MTTLTKLRILQEKQRKQVLNQVDVLALLNYIVDLAAEWNVSNATSLKPITLIIENPRSWRRHGLKNDHILVITNLLSASLSEISALTTNIEAVEAIQTLKGIDFLNLLVVLDEEDIVKSVVSVNPSSFSDVNVVNGIVFSSLSLPTSTVATLSNGETIELSILWVIGTYDKDVDATYTLAGTLVIPNDHYTSAIALEVDVIVGADCPALVNGLSFADDDLNDTATIITLGAPSVGGNTFRYLISSDANAVPTPDIGDNLAAWTSVVNGASITTTNGKHIGVAEVNGTNLAVQFSDATAIVQAE